MVALTVLDSLKAWKVAPPLSLLIELQHDLCIFALLSQCSQVCVDHGEHNGEVNKQLLLLCVARALALTA